MSVCTGAFRLGRVGLLDGLKATTHHEFYDAFQKEFPKATLERTPRFVDGGRIAIAGGLTSAIDLALPSSAATSAPKPPPPPRATWNAPRPPASPERRRR